MLVACILLEVFRLISWTKLEVQFDQSLVSPVSKGTFSNLACGRTHSCAILLRQQLKDSFEHNSGTVLRTLHRHRTFQL
jgi:hypothetical protein